MGFSAWGIQSEPFAACLSGFVQKISKFFHFYTGALIFYYPRERMVGKGNSPKMDEIQEFLFLGLSNWTICSLLIRFCSKNFPTSTILGASISYYPRKGRMGIGNSPKMDDTGVSVLGAFKLDHLQPVNLIMFQNNSNF